MRSTSHRDMSNSARKEDPLNSWESVHLPFIGGIYDKSCDVLIRDFVAPLIVEARVRSLVGKAFFIRYSEGGPHVRLRLLPRPRAPEAIRCLVEDAWSGYLQEGRAGRTMRLTPSWVPYEPELARYGGAVVMRDAENCFDASSTMALAVLSEEVSGDRSLRLGRACLAAWITLHVFFRDRRTAHTFVHQSAQRHAVMHVRSDAAHRSMQEQFAAHFGMDARAVIAYLDDAWDRLECDEPLLPALDQYREALQRYAAAIKACLPSGRVSVYGVVLTAWERAAAALGSSLIHMTSNRLGISTFEEAYMMHALEHVLNGSTT